MKKANIKELPLALFGVLWIFFLFVDYINKHPIYELSIQYFKFPKYGLSILAISALVGLLFKFGKQKAPKFLFTGLGILAFSFLIAIITTAAYIPFTETKTGFGDTLKYAFKGLIMFFPLLLILLSTFALGDFAIRRFKIDLLESSIKVLSVALGIMLFSFVMFLLGLVGMLKNYTLIPALCIPLLINYKSVWRFFKDMFLTPIIHEKSNLSFLSGFLLTLLLTFLVMNFLGAIAPFPAGFDSRNFYVNISKLLGDYEGLVNGFQPYTWSMFMAIGIIAFNSIEITLLISFSGILLTLWAGYELCTNYLKLGLSNAILAMLLLILLPSIFNQMTIELKIDFGLLFIQFCTIFLVVELINRLKVSKGALSKPILALVLLLSIFTGFAIGVKLTHLYMLFAIMMLLWTMYCGYFGFLASFFLILFVILIGRLDDVSGMRTYHLGISYLQWICLVLSLGFFAFSFFKQQEKFLNVSKLSVVIAFVSMLVFSPWVIKNFVDNDQHDVNTLLLGGKPGPDIGINDIINNYQNKNKK